MDALAKQRERSELIMDLNGFRGTPACKTLVTLLQLLLTDARESNDTAQGELLSMNQGKIAICKTLLDAIEYGLAKVKK